MSQKWQAIRKSPYRGSVPRVVERFVIKEVTEDRVRGIEVLAGENLFSNFDVKLHPGPSFYKGNSSGSIRYYLNKVD